MATRQLKKKIKGLNKFVAFSLFDVIEKSTPTARVTFQHAADLAFKKCSVNCFLSKKVTTSNGLIYFYD